MEDVSPQNEHVLPKQAQRAVEGEAPSPPFPRRGGGGDASPYERTGLSPTFIKAEAPEVLPH